MRLIPISFLSFILLTAIAALAFGGGQTEEPFSGEPRSQEADGISVEIEPEASIRPEVSAPPRPGVEAGIYTFEQTVRRGTITNTSGRTIYIRLNAALPQQVTPRDWDFRMQPGERLTVGADLDVSVESVGVYFERGAVTDEFSQRLAFWR
ncbi:MAG: hypothetical protein ACOCYG_04205 [Spirochaetota bacterium]